MILDHDRDGDGIPYSEEITRTDPKWDSDGDGMGDGDERDSGGDPNDPDANGNGVLDGFEQIVD